MPKLHPGAVYKGPPERSSVEEATKAGDIDSPANASDTERLLAGAMTIEGFKRTL
jgi:hypothetical protein